MMIQSQHHRLAAIEFFRHLGPDNEKTHFNQFQPAECFKPQHSPECDDVAAAAAAAMFRAVVSGRDVLTVSSIPVSSAPPEHSQAQSNRIQNRIEYRVEIICQSRTI